MGEVRLSKTINNIAGEKLEKTDNSEEIARTFEDTYADLGYKNTKIIFTTPENTPQLRDEKGNPKAGTAYVDKETGKRTILINVNDEKNYTKAGLIGTIAEEGSHVINALENRKVETGTDEKGLESTGRATNEYFKNLYSKNDKKITLKSDGEDYSNVDFGENVGDIAVADDVLLLGVAGAAVIYTGTKFVTSEEGKEKIRQTGDAIDSALNEIKKKGHEILNGVIKMKERYLSKGSTKNERKANDRAVEKAKEEYQKAKEEYEKLRSKPNKTPEDKREIDKAKKEMDNARERQRKSEDHSRRGKGQQSKGGGNKK